MVSLDHTRRYPDLRCSYVERHFRMAHNSVGSVYNPLLQGYVDDVEATRCSTCGTLDPIEIREYAAPRSSFICHACGSDRAEQIRSPRSRIKLRPPSVSRAVSRARDTEATLPPSAMERFYHDEVLAAVNAELRDDLVDLLEELAS